MQLIRPGALPAVRRRRHAVDGIDVRGILLRMGWGIRIMTPGLSRRRASAGHITLGRAARLYRMVTLLAARPRRRPELLSTIRIGLRTFYRELDMLKRLGVQVKLDGKAYTCRTTAREAEELLPFPDPQLSFAELAELATGSGSAAQRLAALYAEVTSEPATKPHSGRVRQARRKR